MQRLIARFRRLENERGASAVVLSLLLVPMLGFAAIAVDVGALYAEKARLQVAADAAALAVAQDCSRGACGDMLATAQALITANDGEGTAARPVLSSAPLSVTVTGSTPKEHWFAPVLGYESTAVSATATVGWGGPSQGTAVLPLTFSWCEFEQMTGGGLPSGTTVRTIYFTKTSNTTGCTGPSNNVVPGGFAYLDTDPGKCAATTAMGAQWTSKTGNSVPSACSTGDFSKWVGRTVLLPLFDESGLTGTNAWYHVYGYAAFQLTGYSLGGQYDTTPKPCNGNERCIAGYFTRFVELSDAWNYSPDAPQLGSSVLRLIR
ncbi:MAG TPA: pilus assembly protein TadG-related protein [Blastococcus sp.]|nr:pilus assembly protein TadG-related protein [Blastococcus sp.]